MTDQRNRSDRRSAQRRQDPHERLAKLIFGLVIGGFLIMGGLGVILWAVASDTVNNLIAGVGVVLILIGGVASMPEYFLPLISDALKRIPFGKNGRNGAPGAITRALRPIETPPEESDEEDH